MGDAPRARQTLPAAAGPPARRRASQVNVNTVLAVVAVATGEPTGGDTNMEVLRLFEERSSR